LLLNPDLNRANSSQPEGGVTVAVSPENARNPIKVFPDVGVADQLMEIVVPVAEEELEAV